MNTYFIITVIVLLPAFGILCYRWGYQDGKQAGWDEGLDKGIALRELKSK